jgi:hypothetical protein
MRQTFTFDQALAEWIRPHGPMLSVCPVAGCSTLTMGGGTCVAHDLPVNASFVRGRPYVAAAQVEPAAA